MGSVYKSIPVYSFIDIWTGRKNVFCYAEDKLQKFSMSLFFIALFKQKIADIENNSYQQYSAFSTDLKVFTLLFSIISGWKLILKESISPEANFF